MKEETVQLLKDRIRNQLELGSAMSDEEFSSRIEREVFRWCLDHPITAGEKIQLVRRLFHAFRGLDLLQPLMDDPAVTEIMINSHKEMFVERRGQLSRLPMAFESKERLEDLIQSVVAGVNRVVNESTPIVDARLKDGSRIHIVLPPVALKGPTMTIRKFPERPLLMDDLIACGALSSEAASMLSKLVRAKYNIFISGGTGSGKTTFLNALTQFIPEDERIVTIEDAAELQIRTVPNLVSLETRNANTEGKGAISMRELIRASLRMRPNRIVVGEVRGGEAIDMLAAMNTGHDGSLSTGHSNSARDMIARLETMVLSGADLPIAVIRQQISSAIDIIVHLSRLRDRSRRVIEISEVIGVRDGEVMLQSLYRFQEDGEREGRVLGALRRCENMKLQGTWKLQMAGMTVAEIEAGITEGEGA
ncbi:CpaF family protein [Paenibacillus lignilyticus]|uniref:CpaF family protein n=1 Tax=Paenibacillus lignilyticus TaxID=1172615 RepID=A0ABS5CIZ6_9BACL|nr:CpaF family protein [Paenibacillus lignilyticus]MBP3965786.1 CpaF family protein [Paenibacillus lignilyticus]